MENTDEKIKAVETKIAEIRSAKEALAKEYEKKEAFAKAPVETRSSGNKALYASLQDAMKQNRAWSTTNAVSLGDTGSVLVAKDIMYGLEDKDDILDSLSVNYSAKANEIIPVMANTGDAMTLVGENGEYSASGDGLDSVEISPRSFARAIKVTDWVIKLSEVNFESEISKIFRKAMRKTILQNIFNPQTVSGVTNPFSGILTGATAKKYGTDGWNVLKLQAFALDLAAKTDNAVILMNQAHYASLVAGSTKKDEVLIQSIIRDKEIEGVKIILTPYLPTTGDYANIKCVGLELGNICVGVASQLDITPKTAVGSLLHTYECVAYMGQKVANPQDIYLFEDVVA